MTRTTPTPPVSMAAPVKLLDIDLTAHPSDGLNLDILTTFSALEICHSDERISVGITVSLPFRAPETVAATDDIPVRADWLQHQFGQGPAVSPEQCQMVVCKDLGFQGGLSKNPLPFQLIWRVLVRETQAALQRHPLSMEHALGR